MAARRRRQTRAAVADHRLIAEGLVDRYCVYEDRVLCSPGDRGEFFMRYDRTTALHSLFSGTIDEQVAFRLAVAAVLDVWLDPVARRLAAADLLVDRRTDAGRRRVDQARTLFRAAAMLETTGEADLAAHARGRAQLANDLTIARHPTRPPILRNALVDSLNTALSVVDGGTNARYRRIAEIVTQWTDDGISWRQVKNHLTKSKTHRASAGGATVFQGVLGSGLGVLADAREKRGDRAGAARLRSLRDGLGGAVVVPIDTAGGGRLDRAIRHMADGD